MEKRRKVCWRKIAELSYHFFYKKLATVANQYFPSLVEISPPAWDHLISPLEIQLPKSVLQNAQAAIQALYKISRRSAYAQLLEPVEGVSTVETSYNSLLMAYDFHTNEQGDCFLVEVNTNASGYLLTSLMEMTHAESSTEPTPAMNDLLRSLEIELKLWGQAQAQRVIGITDQDLPLQKMYLEFLMYRDFLNNSGFTAEIVESRDFSLLDGHLLTPSGRPVDLVYNRLTDFYLENPAHENLSQAFQKNLVCLSPNPREYWLLADKQRLVQLSTPGFLESAGATVEEIECLKKVLIPSFERSAFGSPEEIWAERRKLFFKPKRSYGGKSVYRGESVSRKVFERLMLEDILIQHFSPAQKVPTDDPRSVLSNWKFDLRFYVYADQIQQVVARIYQGQVTNFASPLGGFTRVQF